MHQSTAGASLGPWLFGTVALLVAAVASYLAGRWQGRSRGRSEGVVPMAPSLPAADSPEIEPDRTPLLALLADALHDDPRPVLLLAPAADGATLALARANAAALALLGGSAESLGRPWITLEPAAPAGLREALAGSGSAEGWWLLHDEYSRSLALGPDSGAANDTASLVYTVTHDLRAPIRVVEGFARIVKEDYGRQLDRVGNDHLDRVLAAGARMNQMIDAVLTVARLASQPLARQPVDLSQQAAYVIEELRRGSPGREVRVDIEPGLVVRGDPTLLRLVLENLLGNAWKYSSRVEVAQIAFGAAVQDGRRAYFVRDNGAGFDMRVADRLFGLFQRLHSTKDFAGTGVGLASVKRIVERHGGRIWAEAEPGRGATFHFMLAD